MPYKPSLWRELDRTKFASGHTDSNCPHNSTCFVLMYGSTELGGEIQCSGTQLRWESLVVVLPKAVKSAFPQGSRINESVALLFLFLLSCGSINEK